MGNPDRINLARIFHTDRNEEDAKADGVPPVAQETAGETAQDFVGSLRQTFKGRDELRQAIQRR